MEYLSMLNFYKRFIPGAAQILSLLYDASKCAGTKTCLQRPVDWTDERVRPFRNLKAALARSAMLVHFVQGAPLALTTDTSDFAHPGVRASVRLVVERFVWHGLNRDVAAWARSCVACQWAKVHRNTDSGI